VNSINLDEIMSMLPIDRRTTLERAESVWPHPQDIPIEEVVARIVALNAGLSKFWSSAEGWAPIEAAHLLSKSRLDWQVSLSLCLRIWVDEPSQEEASGRLILAWANLGSLVEGTMKLFLSAYYDTYKDDKEYAIVRQGKLREPDGLSLELLRQYFKRKIWGEVWDTWVRTVQERRNAIHAYQDRDIGTRKEFMGHVRTYLVFLRYINLRLPYPDDEYMPRDGDYIYYFP
jgi:hypothetical protein